jgi:hypothetical protein
VIGNFILLIQLLTFMSTNVQSLPSWSPERLAVYVSPLTRMHVDFESWSEVELRLKCGKFY